jgi:hypothetical protein
MMLSASKEMVQRESTSSPAIAVNAAAPLRPQACVMLEDAPCRARMSSADEICSWFGICYVAAQIGEATFIKMNSLAKVVALGFDG